jgi:hypothetical protein
MSHGIPSKIKDTLSKLWVWIVLCLTLLIVSIILVTIFPGLSEQNIKNKVGEVIENKEKNKPFFSLPAPGSINFKILGSATSGGIIKPIVRPYTEDYSRDKYNTEWDVDASIWNDTNDWNKLDN